MGRRRGVTASDGGESRGGGRKNEEGEGRRGTIQRNSPHSSSHAYMREKDEEPLSPEGASATKKRSILYKKE
jgi:hypothetical protein